ncbi:MAG: lytic transglycosylase domain-containing protein [Deltaproteobacteria bacterium]|nr:lytic transglycosylase domain-containing protein [Deltaproteobacteria bacterium]
MPRGLRPFTLALSLLIHCIMMNSLPKNMTLKDYWAQALPVRNVQPHKDKAEGLNGKKEIKNFEQALQLENASQGNTTPVKAEIQKAVEDAAQAFSLPISLLHSVIKAESNFNPRASSPAGAKGLMQLMPGTAKEMGVKHIYSIEENVRGGAKYLRNMMDRFDQNVQLALAAYNAGPGAVKKHGGIPPYKETQKYVAKIMKDCIPKA